MVGGLPLRLRLIEGTADPSAGTTTYVGATVGGNEVNSYDLYFVANTGGDEDRSLLMCPCGRPSPNRLHAMRGHRRRADSFTLVEVVIAIGIATFVLISILGLMVYASQTVQQSDKYARLAMVSGQVLSTLQGRSMNSLRYQLNPAGAAVGAGDIYTGLLSTNITFFFTSEGTPATNNSPTAYYRVDVTNATPPAATFKDPLGYPLLEPVQVIIRWPKPPVSTTPFANTNVIVTSIVNYTQPRP